jgi:hypothetical protein
MIREEIRRVRWLKSGGQCIEMRQRLPGFIFEEDDVTVMNDIADTRKGHFARHGINTVLDVKLMTETEISVILADKAFRVSEIKLRELHKQAEQAKKAAFHRASTKTTGKKITLTSRDLGMIVGRMR